MINRFIKLLTLAIALLIGSTASSQTTWNIVPGWNLLGNNSIGPLPVTYPGLRNPDQTNSIWTWNAATSKWSFYAPSMTSSELSAYAQSKGYDVLSSIASKQGFWISANSAFSVTSPWNSNAALAASDITLGWSLVGAAGNNTPSQLNQSLRASLNGAGQDISAVWGWDRASSTWKFYAPSLDAQGGSALSDYINAQGYKPFVTSLTDSEGVWISTSQITPIDPCAVMPKLLGDVAFPSSYSGAFPIPVPTQTLPAFVIRAIGVKDYYPGYLPQNSACQDRVLHARNLYIETLNRLQQNDVQQTFLYNYGPWDDFSKAIWSVSQNDYQIPPSEVAFFVSEANKRNIKVVLAWQFTAVDTKGVPLPMGGTKTPAELRQMLASFRPLIVEQARVGQQIGLSGIYADWHAFWVSNLSSDPVLREIWIVEMMSIIADIKKVFNGKILYGANTAVIDPRIAAVIDQFTLPLGVPYQSIGTSENSNLSVAMVKAAYLSGIQQAKSDYDRQMAGSSISVPINWTVSPQSKYNYFVEGWTEDGFCVNGCAQLNYTTDYSVQAIGIEAAMQAITSQPYFTNGTVDIDCAYWHTDDVGPDSLGWDDYMKVYQYDFPNLSQSIRNKPAEHIVKYWFGR